MNGLNSEGYIIIRNVFHEDFLLKVRNTCDNIFHQELSEENKRIMSKYFLRDRKDQGVMYDVFFRYPIFTPIVTNSLILDYLEKILGPSFFLYENSLLRKSPNTQNEVPWHQDFINRPDEPKKYIVWVAIDDVTIENGALKVLPKSHKNGFLNYHQVVGETHHTRLNLDQVDLENFEYVTLKAGDVLIFDQLLIHSSDRTDGIEPRRAFRFACQGFDMLYTPRCIPYVLRGGEPNQLPVSIKDKAAPPETLEKASLFKKIKRRLKRAIYS